MLTKAIHKLFAKIATLGLVLTMLAPVTGLVQAGPQEGTVRVGMNLTGGAFEVYAITYNPILEEVELVLAMDSATCGLVSEDNGYYCEEVLGTGAYEIRFSPYEDYDLGVYKNGNPSATYQSAGQTIANFQLTTVGIEIYGSYGGNLRVGKSITQGDFEVYEIVYNEITEENELVLMLDSTACTPVFQNDGYYCTMLGAPTGAYEVRFAPYEDYSISVYKNGNPSAVYEDAGETVANFQLTTAGISILGRYGGTLRIGTNLDSADFDVYEIVYNEITEENELVLMMSSTTCTPVFDTNGFYCTMTGMPLGAYTARFTNVEGYDIVVYESGLTHESAYDSGLDKWFANFQLTSEGIDMLGAYFIQDEPLELQVGVNIEEGGFSVYSNDDLVTPIITATGADCTYDDLIDYYVCTYTEADGIAEEDYTVVFIDAGGEYITPANQVIILPIDDPVLGTYTTFPSGTVEVQVVNQHDFPITVPAGSWEIFRCATDDPATCTIPVMTGGVGYIQPGLQYGVYRVFVPVELPTGYVSRQILPSQYQVISTEDDYVTFTIIYTEESSSVDYSFLEVAIEGPTAMDSAEVSIVEDSTSTTLISNEEIDNGGSETFQVDAGEAHTITCHDVTGFTPVTPTINVAGITAGATETVTCEYTESSADEAYIQVSVAGPAGLASAEVSVIEDSTSANVADHDSINNGDSQTYTVNTGEAHTITCHDVTGFTTDTPTINVAALTAGTTESVTCQYSDGSAGDDVDFVITAEDEDGNVMNVDFTYDTGTGTTSDNVEVSLAELDDFTISFSDVSGYITPEDVVVINRSIDTIPAGVTITLNGVPYTAGTEIQEDDTIGILGTYEDLMRLTKTAVEQVIVNNNKRVDYTITVARNDRDTTVGDITITLHDTISNGGGTLAGNNGGTMSFVPGTVTCSNGCGDIVAGDVDVTISNAGNSVTLTYQLLSNNSSIPTGSSSIFTNTVTGDYEDGTDPVHVMNQAQVIVSGPPSGGSTPSGGGGGGGGGGHLLISGDMILQIEKLISLDNVSFKDASSKSNPLGLPENTASVRVYNKVKITNLGKVSATNIILSQLFDGDKSGMSANDVENLKGATMNSNGDIKIEKILVNKTIEFTYSVLVRNTGNNGQLANEALTLEEFGSALSTTQDHLTYLGIGDEFPSYLVAGDVKPIISGDERLRITVTSDKTEANIGDVVNLTIKAKNLTEDDITGLVLTHDYPENALEVLNSYGGRDNGRDVQWQKAILRSGEEVTYQVQIKVGNGAPIGEYVKSLTRALVNEFEGIAPAENSLYILGGVAPTDPNWHLAQTGPAQIFLLLIAIALAYLGYKESWRLRYAYNKRQAIRPL